MKKKLCQIIFAAALILQALADVAFSISMIPERFCGRTEGFVIFLGITFGILFCMFIFCKVLVIALKNAE